MTDREAIDWFTFRKKMGLSDKCQEAEDRALIALQEREERSKGCEYCQNTEPRKILARIISTQTTLSYMDAFSRLTFPVYDYDIDFCPMCGRKLKGA